MIRPQRVAHVVINVTDLERALRFYGDGLGASATGRLDGQMVFLYFGEAGKEPRPFYHDLALYRVEQPAVEDARRRVGMNHVALLMAGPADVDAATERLRQMGVTVLKGPGVHKEDGHCYAYIQDPDGNVVELVAPAEATR